MNIWECSTLQHHWEQLKTGYKYAYELNLETQILIAAEYEVYFYWQRDAILHVSSHTNTAITTTHTDHIEHDLSVSVTKKTELSRRRTDEQVICQCLELCTCLFVEKRWHRWQQRVFHLRSYCDRLPVTTTTATIDRWFCNWLCSSRFALFVFIVVVVVIGRRFDFRWTLRNFWMPTWH